MNGGSVQKADKLGKADKATALPNCDFDPAAISAAQATARINAALTPLKEVETVGLREALGRVLANDMVSTFDVPNHTNSAMDGYAFASAAMPDDMTLEVVGNAFAGAPFDGEVGHGQCVRIMTGAIMPTATDTVVMQEHVEVDGPQVVVQMRPKAGANVRYAGEDMRAGEVVFARGVRVGASQLGVLASIGMATVEVVRRPRVAYFSNGDELRAVGQPLKPGEVYDSNRYTLHAMLARLNVEAIDLGVVADDPKAIATVMQEAAGRADVVITTAGASVGDADYIKDTLTTLGQADFWKVAIKPGRPLAFGKLGDALFFGLPGNPVSVMVTFQVFLMPTIRQLAGEKYTVPTVLRMRTTTDLRKKPGRMEYQRGVMFADADGETVVASTGEQGSGILSSMSQANCFIILADESDGARAGDFVMVQPFDYGG